MPLKFEELENLKNKKENIFLSLIPRAFFLANFNCFITGLFFFQWGQKSAKRFVILHFLRGAHYDHKALLIGLPLKL